jgi:hypothetical protein
MSSPELWETSSHMLNVTGGRWHRNGPIPRAADGDYFTSCLARELRIFPYGRNIGVVVSIVMEKDHQDDQWKKRKAPLRLLDPHRDAKVAVQCEGGCPSRDNASPCDADRRCKTTFATARDGDSGVGDLVDRPGVVGG